MPERRRKFTHEFKDEAVKMVIETSRPIAEVARDIHVNEGTLAPILAQRIRPKLIIRIQTRMSTRPARRR